MHFTGIVRQVDTLGRLVIPRELRKMLDINDGIDSFEIYVNDNKEIVLRKYNPSCALCNNKEQLVIVSYSLDSDKTVWKEAVESLGIDVDGWLHACDGMCLDSPAAKLLGVDKTPRIVLVEPEGRAVSLDMDMDEVVMRVEQILSGDLYYLDKED